MTSHLVYWGQHVMEPSEGCRLWPFTLTTHGYGRVCFATKEIRLNKITCEAWHGARPSNDHMVLHSCGNRACWAGEHLRWGTAQENQDDRINDGTKVFGDKASWSRLTTEQVIEIRERHRAGVSMYQLAKEYDVTDVSIGNIIHRRTWKHI